MRIFRYFIIWRERSYISYFHTDRKPVVTLRHRIVDNHIVVLGEDIVDLYKRTEIDLAQRKVAARREVGGIPGLSVVVAYVFLLVIALAALDIRAVEVPFGPCEIDYARA